MRIGNIAVSPGSRPSAPTDASRTRPRRGGSRTGPRARCGASLARSERVASLAARPAFSATRVAVGSRTAGWTATANRANFEDEPRETGATRGTRAATGSMFVSAAQRSRRARCWRGARRARRLNQQSRSRKSSRRSQIADAHGALRARRRSGNVRSPGRAGGASASRPACCLHWSAPVYRKQLASPLGIRIAFDRRGSQPRSRSDRSSCRRGRSRGR